MAAIHMRYSDHVDYLIASVIYLGTQPSWWARRAVHLAAELSLDEAQLLTVFDGFPGIFRKSGWTDEDQRHFYSLQARYAQRTDYSAHEREIDIPPLQSDRIRLIYDFIVKSADDERTRFRALVGNGIAVAAAVISAMTAILVAYLRS